MDKRSRDMTLLHIEEVFMESDKLDEVAILSRNDQIKMELHQIDTRQWFDHRPLDQVNAQITVNENQLKLLKETSSSTEMGRTELEKNLSTQLKESEWGRLKLLKEASSSLEVDRAELKNLSTQLKESDLLIDEMRNKNESTEKRNTQIYLHQNQRLYD